MARDHRGVVERGLALKKAGNAILETVGGRAIHPVNVRVGGFYRAPDRRRAGGAGADAAAGARRRAWPRCGWVAGFDFPDFTPRPRAARPGRAGPLRHRRAAAAAPTAGWRFDVGRSSRTTSSRSRSRTRPPCTARLAGRGRYLTGPLARYALSGQWLSPVARQAADAAGLGRRVPQPVPQHRGPGGRAGLRGRRGAAADRGVRAAGPAVGAVPAAGRRRVRRDRGAPRHAVPPVRARRRRHGHRRPHRAAHVAEPGRASRTTCAASSQPRLDLDDHQLTHECEQAIRNYDPCISCATHFLDLTVERDMSAASW